MDAGKVHWDPEDTMLVAGTAPDPASTASSAAAARQYRWARIGGVPANQANGDQRFDMKIEDDDNSGCEEGSL